MNKFGFDKDLTLTKVVKIKKRNFYFGKEKGLSLLDCRNTI